VSARWLTASPDPAIRDELAKALNLSPLTAQVLINRGIGSVDKAQAFLNPSLNDLSDPDLLPGIDTAVERVYEAARSKGRLMIYGDYDVDGTASTALLLRFLRLAGLDVDFYVPNRIDEGYGLNLDAIAEFKKQGVNLIITVDCGVGAVEECERAREAGIDVIVTDHHEPGESISTACAVIDPKLTGSLHTFRELAGVGVAFKFAWAVAKRFSPGRKMAPEFREFLINSLGLVALGTVADIVPLVGENRVLAKFGLSALGSRPTPGLRALMDIAQIRHGKLTAQDVAFRLGPRLNAAGRMADAALAIRLMTSDDSIEGHQIASELDRHNIDRRKLQNSIFQHAVELLESRPNFADERAIVLGHDDWHPGVVGIVASKMVDDYNKPSALIAIDGEVGRGSARSVHGFHLFNVLEGFRDRMISFGGHEAAAGFQIARKHIEELRQYLDAAARKVEEVDPELFEPSVDVDAEIDLDDLSERLMSELQLLAPHGCGNRRPAFAARDLHVAGEPRLMGMKGKHISFYVTSGRSSFRALGFNLGDVLYDRIRGGERKCSLVFEPRFDTYSGSGQLELRIQDCKLE
jgi:single-stranded-DNA-specific exonuclease